MRKIGHFLKKAAGWFLVFLGGLMAFESVFLVPAGLLGKLEGSYSENLLMAVTFLFVGAAGLFLFSRGRKLCTRKQEPELPAAVVSEEPKPQPVQSKAAPEEKTSGDNNILLEKTWGGKAEHGQVHITLRPVPDRWNVQIRAAEYDATNNPTAREENFSLNADYFQTRDAREVQELFAAKSGGIRVSREELVEKIPGLRPADGDCALPDDIPPLSQSAETGDVGYGDRQKHWDSHGTVYITMTGTPAVKFFWYEDGTLLFVGKGKTRTVEMGGHDGRNTYEPESPPWSERVCSQTRRAVFTEGITSVGSGLLQSLQKLEILELADSVSSVDYNDLKSLRVLRAGKNFKGFRGRIGPLTELSLPEGPVHFEYYNAGVLPSATGATPEVQKILDDHLAREFQATMDNLFGDCPGLAKKLLSLASLDKTFAAAAIGSLARNSKYRSAEDLWARHGLPKNVRKGQKSVCMELKWHYGFPCIVDLATMAHAALVAKPETLVCSVDNLSVERGNLVKWWRREFPGIALHLTMKNGEIIVAEKADLLNPMPSRQEMQAVKKTLSAEERERMHERFYQYTQDVQRGGTDPEIAAASRGLVFIDGQVADPELLEIAKRHRAEANPDPYRRASRPYEVAGPGRQSLLGEEQKYLLFLSGVNLAEKLEWGQSEYFAVDTRSLTPYYILEQYDGAVAAQSWYEIKEPVTWAELEHYADPVQKYILGHSKDSKWSTWLAAFQELQRDRLIQRWRRFHGGVWEAVLVLGEESYNLTYPDLAGKSKTMALSREELTEEALREKTGLPVYICRKFSQNANYLRRPRK